MESRLREAREGRGLSQKALARRVGVSRNTIVAIERGDSVPNVLLAIAIAGALAWAVDQLFRAVRTGGADFLAGYF